MSMWFYIALTLYLLGVATEWDSHKARLLAEGRSTLVGKIAVRVLIALGWPVFKFLVAIFMVAIGLIYLALQKRMKEKGYV